MWKLSNMSLRANSPNTTQSDSDESLSGAVRPDTEYNSNLETASRAELVRYVQVLTKQSGTYERRFKDVVRAYKHLQTERDTLETSLKASLAQRTLSRPTGVGGDSEGESSQEDKDNVTDDVSVLTQAVATLTEEKARIEANYQEDKKQSIHEQKCQRKTLTDNLEQAEKDLCSLLKERQGLKEEVINLKTENTQLSLACSELRERIAELEKGLSEREESRYLQQILSLQRQVEEANESWRISELKAEETDKILREQRSSLGDQEMKISKIESELRLSNRQRYDTTSDLEGRVAELSGLVGRYQTQVTSQDREISELRQETYVTPQSADSSQLDTIIKLSEQENRLRTTLHTILRHVLLGESIGVEEACAMSTSELLTLLARHKPEVTPIHSPQTDSDKLCEEYRLRLDDAERNYRVRERELSEQLIAEREKGLKSDQLFEREVERKAIENKSKIGALESQLLRLREHTSSLLADKDSEICRLKNRSPSDNLSSLPYRDQQPTESAVNQFISVSGYYNDNNISSLHVSQTKLRKKNSKREAALRIEETERAVREVEGREIKHLEQLSFLQNEINRMDNCLARKDTNLEYLKNVVLQFVTGGEGNKKELLVPLSSVLKLTADESRLLSKSLNLKW
ncbi:GRIP and coiled-coil domain-containing protein 1-like [Oopsacas minuta]|uniref:GRIP and coiled-coil domain-containing protein 1-like n=1 Tax=Oopsacas minuta TaxID=111878 RepID=A0AAV7JDF7_9METZ|nr:GRIP and coiled-coil domain-containing protein 1-like [Oopsacas minuta]